MQQLTTIEGLRTYRQRQAPTQTVGLVPTMGALHPGHFSLVQSASQENDTVIVSIFLNPLQFSPQEDLQAYPQTLTQDLEACRKLGVVVVFTPSPAEMGLTSAQGQVLQSDATGQTTTVVPPAHLTQVLCGRHRPGHFTGVATIVTKLLQIVQPTRAYFGQKDAQQVAILRQMVTDLRLPVEIRTCPIVRELSGLAYSSRNQYLTAVQRQQATVLYRSLKAAQLAFGAGDRDGRQILRIVQQILATEPAVRLEYAEIVHPDTLRPLTTLDDRALVAIAVYLGSTRLIDNMLLQDRRPIIAIDGPAGVGKSTVTRQLAQRLNLLYLDTGAMYRAITWLVQQQDLDVHDEVAIAELVAHAQIQFVYPAAGAEQRVLINGEDVTAAIRTPAVTAQVSAVARHPAVRRQLVAQQQQWGQKGGIIAEGRDIGTQVFPEAEVKIFLTASPQERARRRWRDLWAQGQAPQDLETLAAQIQERDRQDSTRTTAPLRKAPDATEIVTDHLSIAEVIAQIEAAYQKIQN